MPGDYITQGGALGLSMAPGSYTPPQMPPHPSQLRHGPPMHPSYIPSHHPHHAPHHHAMMMHGGAGMGMAAAAASPSAMLTPGDPSLGGQVMDIHAQ